MGCGKLTVKPLQSFVKLQAIAALAEIGSDADEVPDGAGWRVSSDVVAYFGFAAGTIVSAREGSTPKTGEVVLVRFRHSSGKTCVGLRGFYGPNQLLSGRADGKFSVLSIGQNGRWVAEVLGPVSQRAA